MPRIIELIDPQAASLEEAAAGITAQGFDPHDEESLMGAALWLRRLGNNHTFLGDLLIEQLAQRHRDEPGRNVYSPQVVMLVPPGGSFFIRANIWPAADDHMVRASGDAAFAIGLPHDHNFSFLTHGYFGPGYWSDYYEYDFADVTGYRGEPVPSLRFIEHSRLEPGKLMLYRAHRDVHAQLPADSLSVSLNVMHTAGAQGCLTSTSSILIGARSLRNYRPHPARRSSRSRWGWAARKRSIWRTALPCAIPATQCDWRRGRHWHRAKPMRIREKHCGARLRDRGAGWWQWKPRRGGRSWN